MTLATMPGLIVLIIDDDEESLHLLGKLLHPKQYQVHNAGNGFVGLRMAMKLKPDLILLDIHMEMLDGLALAAMLKKQDTLKRMKIVAITADTAADLKRMALEVCDDFLLKPIGLDNLTSCIRKVTVEKQVIISQTT